MGMRMFKELGFIYKLPKNHNFYIPEITLETFKNLIHFESDMDRLLLENDLAGIDLKQKLEEFIQILNSEDSGFTNDIIVIKPPLSAKSWSQYDNIFDYIDFSSQKNSHKKDINKITKLNKQIFPYDSNGYMVRKSKKKLTEIQATHSRMFEVSAVANFTDEYKKELEELGFDLTKTLSSQIKPLCPTVVYHMAQIMDINPLDLDFALLRYLT